MYLDLLCIHKIILVYTTLLILTCYGPCSRTPRSNINSFSDEPYHICVGRASARSVAAPHSDQPAIVSDFDFVFDNFVFVRQPPSCRNEPEHPNWLSHCIGVSTFQFSLLSVIFASCCLFSLFPSDSFLMYYTGSIQKKRKEKKIV